MGVDGINSTTPYQGITAAPDVPDAPGPDRDGDSDDNATATTTAAPVKSPTPPQVGSQVDISA